MVHKVIRIAKKIIVLIIIVLINQFLKQVVPVETDILGANIDGGIMILILLGMSYGGYKLYVQEKA